ncbi:MAG: hypothetical protein LIO97_00985 [Tannerellaceae bacterium]|nr:hypothetical protein [Tannerellaceae bacterium]
MIIYLFWQNAKTDKLSEYDIWRSDTRIGITKSKDGDEDDKDNFYKNQLYTLEKEFCFAFFAEFDFSVEEKLESDFVTLGGERSLFRMEVKEIDSYPCLIQLQPRDKKSIKTGTDCTG